MRVTDRLQRDDRGAVLILVSVFAIVAVVFLAFVVDIGNQRQDRRQLTTATDAAALDVAQTWADNSLEPLNASWSFAEDGSPLPSDVYNCTAEAEDYLNRNRAVEAGGYTCRAEFKNDQLASVAVVADGTTPYEIAQAIGRDSGQIGSASGVRIRSGPGGGLRPFAVCAQDNFVRAWMNANGAPEGAIITIVAPTFLDPNCERNNANWGFLEFDDQANGAPGLEEALKNGTEQAISSFVSGDEDYGPEREVCYDDGNDGVPYNDQTPSATCLFTGTASGNKWSSANTRAGLQYLKSSRIRFSLPLYGRIAEDPFAGQTGFPIIAFAEVRLVDFHVGSGIADPHSLTLEFLSLSSGDCCDVNESNNAFEICEVGTAGGALSDPATFAANCQTGGGTSVDPPTVPDPQCVVTSISIGNPQPTRVFGDELQHDLNVTANILNYDVCGSLDMRIVRASDDEGKSTFERETSGPTYVASESKSFSRPWVADTYRIELTEDGIVIGSLDFPLS